MPELDNEKLTPESTSTDRSSEEAGSSTRRDRSSEEAGSSHPKCGVEHKGLPLDFIESNGSPKMSEESKRLGAAMPVRSTDLFIATAPKTGTTLLQWMFHLLRTKASPEALDFQDIYQVSPWADLSYDIGIDNDAGTFQPRVFKSHLRLASLQRGGRAICTVRRPEAVARSFYDFLRGKGYPSVVAMENVSEFVFSDRFRDGMAHGASIWDYYEDMLKCKEHPDVLVLVFEDLVKDIRGHAQRIATFMGFHDVATDSATLDAVASLCTKEAMSSEEHMHKFDETWAFERAVLLGRMPNGGQMMSPSSRVVLRQKDDIELSSEAKAFLHERWQERFAGPFGLDTYEALCGTFRDELARRDKSKEAIIESNGEK